jgi:SAM-dependent methyltransferase
MSLNHTELGEPSHLTGYDLFASIYDERFREYSHQVLPVLERLCLGDMPSGSAILDVCCGAGHLAAILVERGYRVVGVDRSAEMLRIARQNAKQAEFLLADVRTLRLPSRFDVAVSTFDSINHILEFSDLEATFRNVAGALRFGGRFVFDMNMAEGYLCRWGGTMRGTDRGREFVIRATYSSQTRLGRNVVTWQGDGPKKPLEVTFLERCYSEQEVRTALTRAGFGSVKVYDGHRHLDMTGEIGRAFFVCEKGAADESPSECENRRRARDLATCVDDAVWPEGESSEAEALLLSQRLRAIGHVLCTLPAGPYERLRQVATGFRWYLPAHGVLGSVPAFESTYEVSEAGKEPRRFARVLYLSPLLEWQEWPVAVSVAVHELAHVILEHRSADLDRQTFDRQEQAANQAVREWGFGPQADRAAEFLRNQDLNRRRPNWSQGIHPARVTEPPGRATDCDLT